MSSLLLRERLFSKKDDQEVNGLKSKIVDKKKSRKATYVFAILLVLFLMVFCKVFHFLLFESFSHFFPSLISYSLLMSISLLVASVCVSFLLTSVMPYRVFSFLESTRMFLEENAIKLLIIYACASPIIISYGLGLFSRGPVLYDDHTLHYYNIWYTLHKAIPKFKNIVGWDPFFAGGYQINSEYPAGSYVFVSALYYLGCPIEIGYKVLIFLYLILLPLSFFYVSRSFGLSKSVSIVATLLFSSYNSLSYHLITGGTVPYHFSVPISFFFLGSLRRVYSSEDRENIVTSGILLGLVVLLHIVQAAVTVLFMLGVLAFQHRKEGLRRLVLKSMVIFFIAFLVSAIWLVPMISSANYILHETPWWIEENPTFGMQLIFPIASLLFYYPLYQWILAPLGTRLMLKKKSAYGLVFLLLFSFILYVISTQVEYLQIIKLRAALASRFVLFTIGFSSITVAGYMVHSLSANSTHKVSFQKKRSSRKFGFKPLFLLLFLLVSPIFLTMNYFLTPPDMMASEMFDPEHWVTYEMLQSSPRLDHELDDDVQNVFNWIKNETDNSFRVLLEGSGHLTVNQWRWIHLAIAPMYTNQTTYFFAGPYPYFGQIYVGHLMPSEGHILGKKLPIPIAEFEQALKNYNVKYLVVWSSSFKDFLSNLSSNPEAPDTHFGLVEEVGRFSIYEYLDCPRSYIIQNNDILSSEVTQFDEMQIIVHVDVLKPTNVTISSTYFPLWQACVDGRQTNIFSSNDFISVRIPESGEHELTFDYREPPVYALSKYTSLVSLPSLLTLIFILHFRRRQKHGHVTTE